MTACGRSGHDGRYGEKDIPSFSKRARWGPAPWAFCVINAPRFDRDKRRSSSGQIPWPPRASNQSLPSPLRQNQYFVALFGKAERNELLDDQSIQFAVLLCCGNPQRLQRFPLIARELMVEVGFHAVSIPLRSRTSYKPSVKGMRQIESVFSSAGFPYIKLQNSR
jgi:hypothetical protein